MAIPTAHYADSDADDEYERSVLPSPRLPTDDETSPTDSDPPSTEHTPTFGHIDSDKLSPDSLITEWTAPQCADYVSNLGLPQYCAKFLGMSSPAVGPGSLLSTALTQGCTRKRNRRRSLDCIEA